MTVLAGFDSLRSGRAEPFLGISKDGSRIVAVAAAADV
jgi:hypothetical protein